MRILQRYVLNDLLRVFGLSIFVLTVLLVVMGVAGEAAKRGLGATQILQITPWIIPSLLPYTIPATLLLTVCIVYGRMAGDHEIAAIKAAGINVFAVLGPSFVMGAVLSLGTFILTDQFIPLGRAKIEKIVALAMEDIFLEVLRANNTYNDPAHGISIHVTRVEDRARSGRKGGRKGAPEVESAPSLIDPIFRYRLQGGEFATITAREATVQFDMNEQQVLLALFDGHCETPGHNNFDFEREDQAFPMPAQTDTLKAPRNMTIDSLRHELIGLVRERDAALHRQVIKTVLALSGGDFERLSASEFQQTDFLETLRAERQQKLRTEIHGRVALSCSCFFFVLIGSPIAIIWGKRQFLTNFALCFTPILLGYYPIVLLTMNLCRDGVIEPAWGMWVGNAGLLATAIVVLRKVFRN
jgi:lipopolysaccharide export system permease protein